MTDNRTTELLNEVADRWAEAKNKAENYALENMLLKIDNDTRWYELFGTPEIAAETLMDMCQSMGDCGHCPLYLSGLAFCDNGDYEGDVLEWLESEVRDD